MSQKHLNTLIIFEFIYNLKNFEICTLFTISFSKMSKKTSSSGHLMHNFDVLCYFLGKILICVLSILGDFMRLKQQSKYNNLTSHRKCTLTFFKAIMNFERICLAVFHRGTFFSIQSL